MKKIIIFITVVIFLFNACAQEKQPQILAENSTDPNRIHLNFWEKDGDCNKTVKVARGLINEKWSTQEKVQEALNEFLSGLAESYEKNARDFLTTDFLVDRNGHNNRFMLQGVKVENATVYINWKKEGLEHMRKNLRCKGPESLVLIEKTLTQFPEITRVVHAVNASPYNFYTAIDISCPEKIPGSYCDPAPYERELQEAMRSATYECHDEDFCYFTQRSEDTGVMRLMAEDIRMGRMKVVIDDLQKAAGLKGGYTLFMLSKPASSNSLFLYEILPESDAPAGGVWRFNKKTNRLSKLTSIDFLGWNYKLSPNGKHLLWQKEEPKGVSRHLYLIDLENDKKRVIVTLPECESLNGGTFALGSNFQIHWVNENLIQYAVFDQCGSQDKEGAKKLVDTRVLDLAAAIHSSSR